MAKFIKCGQGLSFAEWLNGRGARNLDGLAGILSGRSSCKRSTKSHLLEYEVVVFNDRVAEEFVTGIVDGFPGCLTVRVGGEINLDVLADVNALNPLVAHVSERGLNSLALRINDGLL